MYSARPDLHRTFPKNIVLGRSNWTPELVDTNGKQNSPPVIQAEAEGDLLSHLGAHKSMGPGGIHPKVMRKLVEELTLPLSIIYHKFWLTRENPDG